MLQSGGEQDLPEEPVGTDGRGQRGVQHLERHRAVVPQVPCEIHGGHTPATELPVDGILAAQRSAQGGEFAG